MRFAVRAMQRERAAHCREEFRGDCPAGVATFAGIPHSVLERCPRGLTVERIDERPIALQIEKRPLLFSGARLRSAHDVTQNRRKVPLQGRRRPAGSRQQWRWTLQQFVHDFADERFHRITRAQRLCNFSSRMSVHKGLVALGLPHAGSNISGPGALTAGTPKGPNRSAPCGRRGVGRTHTYWRRRLPSDPGGVEDWRHRGDRTPHGCRGRRQPLQSGTNAN
mmetsp:Transcript_72909/g.202311  ORF Transcript_72909/g.202311 Transcript_72909/m.202311 type:complete len:222 (+) Transcript_72909:884-1549(+)